MDRLASVLLVRAGQLHLPSGHAQADGFVDHLEVDLAERGWLVDPTARDALSRLPSQTRTAWSDWLLATIDADSGADRPHVPLFRRFPDTTPANTDALYVDRVLTLLFQEPEQPCVLCGRTGTVHAVSPCGHLVCRSCWDGADYSACPVCHRRLDADDPFLQPRSSRWRPPLGMPLRMRRIVGRADQMADAVALRDAMIARPTPLSGSDRGDLSVLLEATTAPGELDWLPEQVPSRETLAVVLAAACARDLKAALPTAEARWTTATDVARTLWVLSGNEPGLVLPERPSQDQRHVTQRLRPADEPRVVIEKPRVGPIPRPLRRAALAALGRLDLRLVVEDVLRHRTVWKRLGERLHPFEDAARHPAAAVAFAVLRGSWHQDDSAVGRAIVAAGAAGHVRVVQDGPRVQARARTFAAAVEHLLRDGAAGRATALLSTRPGELLRRLDQLARLSTRDELPNLAEQAGKAAATAAPLVALSALAAVHGRDKPPPAAAVPVTTATATTATAASSASQPGFVRRLLNRVGGSSPAAPTRRGRVDARIAGQPRRVFFPRGNVLRAWSVADVRQLLPDGTPELLQQELWNALLRRAEALPHFDVAVLDAALAQHPVPTRARTASPSSRTLLRGARVPLPDGDTLRLFLHWTQPDAGTRVDLDLSALFLDAAWQYVGHCDYTRLRWHRGAVHSGDLTSAPPPEGATEFLDLDLPELRAKYVAHVVPIVFSYNDVPFDRLRDAIAGFMLPEANDALFDAARVAQRFDLVGDARVLVPAVVHLQDRTLRWADLNVSSTGYGHAVQRYSTTLGHAAEDLELAFGTGRRANMLQLAALHAAGRARQVWLRYPDGSARRVPAATPQALLDAAEHGDVREISECLPELHGQVALVVAADTLPSSATDCAPGSVLVVAAGGDPSATDEPADLLHM